MKVKIEQNQILLEGVHTEVSFKSENGDYLNVLIVPDGFHLNYLTKEENESKDQLFNLYHASNGEIKRLSDEEQLVDEVDEQIKREWREWFKVKTTFYPEDIYEGVKVLDRFLVARDSANLSNSEDAEKFKVLTFEEYKRGY